MAYGERGRGVTPFRSIPPLHSGVPPNFGERKGRLGRGRSPGLESRGLSWARGRGGGLSVPRGAGWSWRLGSVCVLEVEAEAVQELILGQFQFFLLPEKRRDEERGKEGIHIRVPEERSLGGFR